MEKSQLVFSSNVEVPISARFSSKFGISISQEFGLCLGMPRLYRGVRKGITSWCGEGEEKA